MRQNVKLTVCVFCASSDGYYPPYREVAVAFGRQLAAQGWGLMYGGASVGLMGAVADAALAGGAPVCGVLPAVLEDREVAHTGLTELHFVPTMHARKAMMAERAHAFVCLPGGFGTLDELFEILSWAQLGIHSKLIVLINPEAFFDGLITFLWQCVTAGFLRAENLALLHVVPSVDEAIHLLERLVPAGLPPAPLQHQPAI
ncbi:TIGR00730 family Rossman fold protein [Acidipila sp. EB88]|uniref:LOG family protein n=1 Tax=Acidipila sp. EB88 TaxID=2305226 RepID=UPI000F5E8E20|nr:TIGR00730 family Rossman fold protein [Acidipila sp. EB88]RRA48028.1 TIGR00730 family Rossman fold protein [Acidipila sp. EB88]